MGQCLRKSHSRDCDVYAYDIIHNSETTAFIPESNTNKYTEFPKISNEDSK